MWTTFAVLFANVADEIQLSRFRSKVMHYTKEKWNGIEKQYLNYLNVIACFCVLWDHVNGRFFQYEHSSTWVVSAVIHVIANIGVPVFAMISGATLLNYRERYSTKEFFERRCKKVLIPFLFWSIVYMLIQIRDGIFEFSVKGMISGVLNSSFNNIFWFFIPLFGAYLAVPILSAIEEKYRRRVFNYCIAGYLLFGQALPLLLKWMGITFDNDTSFIISGFIFYVIVGYYIDNYEINKRTRALIYSVGMVSLLFNISDCILQSLEKGEITRVFSGCFSLTYSLTPIAVFMFAKQAIKNRPNQNGIIQIRNVTFGIYLVQMLVFRWVQRLAFVDAKSMIYILIGEIPVFIICMIICIIIKRIPGIRNLI